MSKIIGVDLGTTNSCVSVMEGSDAIVIPNSEGGRTTPSIVAFTKSGEKLVGQSAKRQAVTNPINTIFSIKRFMGRNMSEITDELKEISYKVKKGPNGSARVEIDGKLYSPPEISAMILAKMKKTAEEYLGEEVTEAVITVPAYFNDAQRQATKDAGEIAGLVVKRIINEPTAAALAYGLDKKNKEELVAVYDLGGGTFDVSILQLGEGIFEVKSTSGDTHLGGDDFDKRLIDYLADEFLKQEGIDLRKDPMALQRLKEGAEKAKIELSSGMSTGVNLPFITATQDGPKHLDINISRAKFEALVDDLIERSVKPCLDAIKSAGVSVSEIDEVILVGGSTRIPKVQEKVKEIFGREPHKGVNPDEVVSLGAAIQGGVLSGDINDVLLLDVTPLSLGIETMGNIMTKLIDANSTIPIKKSQIFSTAVDNQPGVDIHVLQGERPMATDNRTLGRFQLSDIPPAQRGVPQIEVEFNIDANGIIQVSAKDKATNKEQSIKITSSGGLSDEEIEKMKNDAKVNAEDDKKKKEKAETKNNADMAIFSIKKALEESKDKISAEQVSSVEAEIIKVEEALKTEDIDAIKSATESLNSVWTAAYTKLQQSQQAQQTEQPQQKQEKGEPVEASYEEVV